MIANLVEIESYQALYKTKVVLIFRKQAPNTMQNQKNLKKSEMTIERKRFSCYNISIIGK